MGKTLLLFGLSGLFEIHNMHENSFRFRCRIPECDADNGNIIFEPHWLQNAVPFKNKAPEKCSRFGTNTSIHSFHENFENECPVKIFNHSETIGCTEFVFKTHENRISNEVKYNINHIVIASYRLRI